MPQAGEIVQVSDAWEQPGGGGSVAAVQLAKLAGGATFFTALGDDALGHEAFERLGPGDLEKPPKLVVRTAGAAGGSWERSDGEHGTYEATPLPGPVRDAYGCGDSFAAGLTYGLGGGAPLPDALALAARCGAACL